jgi:uncharacterized protein (TIGR02246 family)
MRFLIFVLTALLFSCNSDQISTSKADDKKKILELHERYRQHWLENDSAKVVNLFSGDAAIIPPNNKGEFAKGKKEIGAWWFTSNGDTTYPITGFDYDYDRLLFIENDHAVLEGSSTVKWVTKAKDVVISSSASSSNYISVFKKENGEWKYFRQVWNAKPKK